MITLNFRKSPEELPPLGFPILVISGNNPGFGYCWDCFEEWLIEGFDGKTGIVYPHDISLNKLPQKDLMVSLNEKHDVPITYFLSELKFLWILKEQYTPIEEFFKL